MRRRKSGSTGVIVIATVVTLGLIGFSQASSSDQPNPVVFGDSLTVQATPFMTSISVFAKLGSNACDWTASAAAEGKKLPPRIVLAFTGNSADWRGPVGIYAAAQQQADCIRAIRADVPASVELVVMATPAARFTGNLYPNGSAIYNQYWRTAVYGGKYPSGKTVGALDNAGFSTALDDRFTPHHVYPNGGAGAALRDQDGLHLSVPTGAMAWASVLSATANGS